MRALLSCVYQARILLLIAGCGEKPQSKQMGQGLPTIERLLRIVMTMAKESFCLALFLLLVIPASELLIAAGYRFQECGYPDASPALGLQRYRTGHFEEHYKFLFAP